MYILLYVHNKQPITLVHAYIPENIYNWEKDKMQGESSR